MIVLSEIRENRKHPTKGEIITTPDAYFLKSGRLQFRRWTTEDIDLAQNLWGDYEVTRYIGGPFNLNEINDRLNKEIDTEIHFGIEYWPMFQQLDNNFVGCCGLRPYKNETEVLELGFHICKAFWGNGYATEAARSIIKYAFEKYRPLKLFAGHNPDNSKSKGILAKLGFQYTHDEYYPPTGLNHPSYELTRESYLKF